MGMRNLWLRLRAWCGVRRAAQGTAEYAICMLMVAPLLIGGVDLGRAVFWYAELANGANEGARVGSFDSNTTNITNATIANSGTFSGGGSITVTVTCYSGSTTTTKTCSSMVVGDTVEVQAATTYTPIISFVASVVGNSMPVSANSKRTYG